MEQEKLKKINVRKVIVYVVMAIVVAIAGLVMYSEKVHKIGFIENIKHAIEEQINPSARSTEASDVTIVDVTGIMPGDIGNHVCSEYYISEYDETNHWNRCKLCGKEYDKVGHSFTDYWSEGASSCHENNWHRYVCDCGYTYKNQNGKRAHSISFVANATDGSTYNFCNICRGNWNYHSCYDSDNKKIGEGYKSGTCKDCGRYYTFTNYCYNEDVVNPPLKDYTEPRDMYCGDKKIGHIDKNEVTEISDGVWKQSLTITFSENASITSFPSCLSYWGLATTKLEIINQSWNGNTCTVEMSITFNEHSEKANYVRIWAEGYLGSVPISLGIRTNNFSPDEIAPVIISVNQDENAPWEKKKEITIAGTENWCSTVKVEILDGEKVIYEGTASVTDNNWSITAVPELEADEIGRNLTVRVTDPCENSSTKEFPIKKVDAAEPKPVEESIVIGGDWAKEKRYTFTASDSGVGNVQIAFNDLTKYGVASVDGTTYAREYKFVGDVYDEGGREAVVYYKDELGNTSTQTIVLEKLDNTAPTITGASLTNNRLTIDAHDRHETLGEGSGVAKYRYLLSRRKFENLEMTESNSTEVAYAESFEIEEVPPYYYVYIRMGVRERYNYNRCNRSIARRCR